MENHMAALLAELQGLRQAVDSLRDGLAPRPKLITTLPPCASGAYEWEAEASQLVPVEAVSRLPLALLVGIDSVLPQLVENTRRFACGLPANNALLWGARGTGKSSSIKAVHADIAASQPELKLIEIQREDLASLPRLLKVLATLPQRFILFCDDLSFEQEDATYKSLKAVLDGGLSGRPDNVLFYASSNRRHLMSRSMIDNEAQTGIHPREAEEEKVSLSDRFGLWLGFHRCDQATYLRMIAQYIDYFQIPTDINTVRAEALTWSTMRGSRSGRVAWQYIQNLAGQHGVKIRL